MCFFYEVLIGKEHFLPGIEVIIYSNIRYLMSDTFIIVYIIEKTFSSNVFLNYKERKIIQK